jgi:hypothetical protein
MLQNIFRLVGSRRGHHLQHLLLAADQLFRPPSLFHFLPQLAGAFFHSRLKVSAFPLKLAFRFLFVMNLPPGDVAHDETQPAE